MSPGHRLPHLLCHGQLHCQEIASMSAQILRFGDTGFAANANRSGCLARTDLQRSQWHKYTQLLKDWGFHLFCRQHEGRWARLKPLMALNIVKAIMQAEQVLPLSSHSQQFKYFRGSGWYKSGKHCHYHATACSSESNRCLPCGYGSGFQNCVFHMQVHKEP